MRLVAFPVSLNNGGFSLDIQRRGDWGWGTCPQKAGLLCALQRVQTPSKVGVRFWSSDSPWLRDQSFLCFFMLFVCSFVFVLFGIGSLESRADLNLLGTHE